MLETMLNLAKAFAGESQARNRYTYYASVAKKEGYEKISAIFAETADQEKEHAKMILKLLNQLKSKYKKNIELIVEASVPTTYGTTKENLESAIMGEHEEYSKMYPEFAKTAKKEGLPDIAKRLENIAIAEKHHEERYKKLKKELENKTMFKKAKSVTWVCRNCGYVHTGKEAPIVCPSCDHPRAHFEVKCENY